MSSFLKQEPQKAKEELNQTEAIISYADQIIQFQNEALELLERKMSNLFGYHNPVSGPVSRQNGTPVKTDPEICFMDTLRNKMDLININSHRIAELNGFLKSVI